MAKMQKPLRLEQAQYFTITQSRDVHYLSDHIGEPPQPKASKEIATAITKRTVGGSSYTILFNTTTIRRCRFLDLFFAAQSNEGPENTANSPLLNFLFDYEFLRLLNIENHFDNNAFLVEIPTVVIKDNDGHQ